MNTVFRILGKGPPHGDVFFDERAVVGLTNLERHRRLASDFNGFSSDIERKPLSPMKVAIAIEGFAVQIDVVVHKHGDAPRMATRVSNDGERQATDVVSVVLQLWCDNVRFVPNRRRRVGDVGVVAEKHLT